jgi:hypothetical protein
MKLRMVACCSASWASRSANVAAVSVANAYNSARAASAACYTQIRRLDRQAR